MELQNSPQIKRTSRSSEASIRFLDKSDLFQEYSILNVVSQKNPDRVSQEEWQKYQVYQVILYFIFDKMKLDKICIGENNETGPTDHCD